MEFFIVGILIALFGTALTVAGYQFYRVLLTVWGFLAGFGLAASIVASLLGQGFLATTTGWVFGIITGFALALASYALYELAVAILVGTMTYAITLGLFLAVGLPDGVIVNLTAIAVGLALAAASFFVKAAKALVVFFTSLAGATTIITGIMLITNQAAFFGNNISIVPSIIGQSIWWSAIWVGLVIAGIVAQYAFSQKISESQQLDYGGYDVTIVPMMAGAKGGQVDKTPATPSTETESAEHVET